MQPKDNGADLSCQNPSPPSQGPYLWGLLPPKILQAPELLGKQLLDLHQHYTFKAVHDAQPLYRGLEQLAVVCKLIPQDLSHVLSSLGHDLDTVDMQAMPSANPRNVSLVKQASDQILVKSVASS